MNLEILKNLLAIIYILADNIYFEKCLFYNVPCLSEVDKEKCIKEAIDILPDFLETFTKYYEYLKQEI